MAPGQNLSSAAYRAADQARRLEHGWIGPEHVLLALFAQPSPATEALEEVGVTRERAEEAARAMGRSDPPPPPYDPGAGLSPNSAWYRLTGCAEGLGLAAGRRWPRPEHFLVAMVYGDHVLAPLLHRAGSSEQALLAALARRGVPVPEADPPAYRPWRGGRHVEVTEAELQPVVGLLIDRHPPGSEWRWGFNWLPGPEEGGPRRAIVDAEEGIDLEAVLEAVRAQPGP
jgi:hypothetical protein